MVNVFIKTAVITTLIFAVGVWIGLWMGEERVSSLELTIDDLQENINNAELQFLLLDVLEKNASCTYMIQTASNLGHESSLLARDVEKYENSQKIDEDSFYLLKQKYTNSLIRNWLTLEKIKETCDGNYSIVLYFYSNEQCDLCEEQGIVLSYMKERLGQDLFVFALDTDIGVDVVGVLKDSYGITNYPATVVNNHVYKEYLDKDGLTKELCDFNENLEIC